MTASSTSWTRGSASHSSQLTHPPGPARPDQRLPVTLDPRPVPPQRRLRRHPQRDHHVDLTPPRANIRGVSSNRFALERELAAGEHDPAYNP